MNTSLSIEAAECIARIFTGVLFFFQGYDKLFQVHIPQVADAFSMDAQRRHIPRSLVTGIAGFTSAAEFAGGLFLVLGLFTPYALYLLGADLLVVGIAFSFMQPMWDMKHVFPRLLLVLLLLFIPQQYRVFSLDHFLHIN